MANIKQALFPGEMSDVNRAMEKLVNLCNEHVWLDQNLKITVPYFVTLQSRGKRKFLAWVSSDMVWYQKDQELAYELNVATETLDRPLEETFVTILHEMCHLWNNQHDVKDITAGQRHNRKFADACELIQLAWEKDAKYGVTTHVPMEKQCEYIREAFAKVKADLGDDAKLLTIHEDWKRGTSEKKSKKSNQMKYECPCCHKSLRATSKLNIICGDCGQKYVNLDDSNSESGNNTLELPVDKAASK